ncbi:WxL domain-containing protein [Enterococcus sp. LJL120]
MKKQIILTGLIVSAFCLVTAVPAMATDDPVNVGETQGIIDFKENNKVTTPKDPENPALELVNPELEDILKNNYVTGEKGPLFLDLVPSLFDFGDQIVEMNEVIYPNIPSEATRKLHYLQVSDNRTKSDGWVVKVTRSEFVNGTDQLTGSTIVLPKGEARNSLNSDPTAVDSNFSTAQVNLTAGEDQETSIFSIAADKAAGKGVSTSEWDAASVSLKIPAKTAKEGNFTSVINWILTAEITS